MSRFLTVLAAVLSTLLIRAQAQEDLNKALIEGRYVNEVNKTVLYDFTVVPDSLIINIVRINYRISLPKIGTNAYLLNSRDTMSFRLVDRSVRFESVSNPNFISTAIKTDYKLQPVKVLRDVMVPMSDGTRIATDIYMPESASEPLPVILTRTPYNKLNLQYSSSFLAESDFVVLVQDVRGKHASEGQFLVQGDRQDTYDAIEWASKQEWSNGNIGTLGCSYSGENQIMVATLKHPSHKAIIAGAAGGAMGRLHDRMRMFAYYEGGAIALMSQLNWFNFAGTTNRDYRNVLDSLDRKEVFNSLPIINIAETYGLPKSDYEKFVSKPLSDPWWDQFGYIDNSHTFNTPALHINTWFDQMAKETSDLFNFMKENSETKLASDNQFLLLLPGIHCHYSAQRSPAVSAGELISLNAGFDYWSLVIDWFNHWLRDESTENFDLPSVTYFTTGSDQWKTSSSWPPKSSKQMPFYLSSNGNANTRLGDGKLLQNIQSPAQDTFIYDPMNPVPSGSIESCCSNSSDAMGSYDQSEIELREDVLVYTSEVLKTDIFIEGNVELVLNVSSSAPDTDFTAKLVEVYPTGKSMNLSEGIMRGRYREGFKKEVFFERDKIYELSIDLHAVSHTIKAGNQIRLEVSSSNFPRFDRNLNTGKNNFDEDEGVIATNSIWHGKNYGSILYLPIASISK